MTWIKPIRLLILGIFACIITTTYIYAIRFHFDFVPCSTKHQKIISKKEFPTKLRPNTNATSFGTVVLQQSSSPLQSPPPRTAIEWSTYERLVTPTSIANDVSELNTELHLLKTENARLKQRDHQLTVQLEELGLSNRQFSDTIVNVTGKLETCTQQQKRISSNQTLQPHPTGKLTIVRNNLKAPNGSHNFKNWQHMNFDSCAVVGSGSSLLNSGYGVDIDNHDAVFRINSAPTKGFQQDVGSFTTFRVSYGITCMHALMTDEVPSNGICTADFTGQGHVVGAFNLMKKDIAIHERLYKRAWGNLLYNHTKIKSAKDLHMFYHLSGKAASYYGLEVDHATSGYNAILASLDLCNSIDLYGFDLGRSMSLNHMPKKAHYYDIYDTTYATKNEGQPHNFLNEWKRINQMTNTTEWVKKKLKEDKKRLETEARKADTRKAEAEARKVDAQRAAKKIYTKINVWFCRKCSLGFGTQDTECQKCLPR